MIKVNQNTLFAAFRYALGRSTYIVDDVVTDIINNIEKLNTGTLKIMKEEIEEAINSKRAGMKMDQKLWKLLLKEIDNILSTNELQLL